MKSVFLIFICFALTGCIETTEDEKNALNYLDNKLEQTNNSNLNRTEEDKVMDIRLHCGNKKSSYTNWKSNSLSPDSQEDKAYNTFIKQSAEKFVCK